jgi:hypothetical protein
VSVATRLRLSQAGCSVELETETSGSSRYAFGWGKEYAWRAPYETLRGRGNARKRIWHCRQQRKHHEERDDGERGRALLLLSDVRMPIRSTGGIARNRWIEPVVRKAAGHVGVSVSVFEPAILGVKEKLQKRMIMRSGGAAAILGGKEEKPEQRQDPEWRYPACKSGVCPQARHESHRQELTAEPKRWAVTLARKVPRSSSAPITWLSFLITVG